MIMITTMIMTVIIVMIMRMVVVMPVVAEKGWIVPQGQPIPTVAVQ